MKILILGALEKEVSVLNNLLKTKQEDSFYYKKMKKNKVYVAVTGIGTFNAYRATTSLIELIHPDIVINIGTAGGHTLEVNDGDIIVCDEAIYHEKDMISSQSSLEIVKADPSLSNLLEKAGIAGVIRHGKTLSGDFFTEDVHLINSLHQKYHHLCEDMETISIYKVCEEKKTPCIAYRIISNNELKGTKYEDNVLKVNKDLEQNIFKLLNYLDSL